MTSAPLGPHDAGSTLSGRPDPQHRRDPQHSEDLEHLRRRHGDPLPRRLAQRLRRLVGADSFPTDYQQALRACQLPVATGRRIGVLSVDGGVGRSTLTAGLGLVLAAARADAVSTTDFGPVADGVASRLPRQLPTTSWHELLTLARQDPEQAVERLHQGLRRAGGSLHLLTPPASPPGGPEPAAGAPAAGPPVAPPVAPSSLSASDVGLLHHLLARTFGVSVLELPPSALPMPAAALAQLHCLLLVSGTAPSSAARTAEHLHRLRRDLPEVPILPVVSATRPASSAERRAAYDLLGAAAGAAPLLIDHDRHLAPGLPISLDLVGEQRRLQLVELAASALSAAVHAPGGSVLGPTPGEQPPGQHVVGPHHPARPAPGQQPQEAR